MNNIDYKKKYLKYKSKYLQLKNASQYGGQVKIYIKDNFKDEISQKITPEMYEEKRIPSFCDRILYKGDSISILNYGTILVSKLCNSDHLLVFGEFEFNGKTGLIITFNIDKYDKKTENINDIKETLETILIKIYGENNKQFDYVVFSFQESATSNNLEEIIKSIIDDINLKNQQTSSISNLFKNPQKDFTYVHSASESWTNQNSRIFVLYSGSNLSPKPSELSKIYLGSWGQYLAGSKAAVGFNVDGICFVCCHLPIDTNKKVQDVDYMGNNLRIDALKIITEKLKECPNVIISGDMNFRVYKDNNGTGNEIEQLTKLVESNPPYLTGYKEFGGLSIKSCKINSNESCKLVM